MIVRFAIQQLSTPATCIARNACTGVLYCAHGKSDDHVFRISAECLTLVRSLLVTVVTASQPAIDSLSDDDGFPCGGMLVVGNGHGWERG